MSQVDHSAGTRPLKPDGKPMRALRALQGSTMTNPLTEYDIYRINREGQWEYESWYGALRTLVQRGLAEKCPAAHSRAQWYITPTGEELLS